ncbi:lysophospholipid acyltransferase family protein [Microlunatus parietis]|uniref:1-acyl-sn-glycerol-3-phosphate acyltransferase n=1 Tax=Microlunatus parietis TaxID=682979 RepID=A0A7Y9LA40_9ACTN|nr:lysophospholipid acyltransferase family protein [Microlunatus parietis]NYE69388.1 1-acyl-sn-glycerol-3-phosphate acyltransferase [Microlunatus parietis]
MEHPRRLPDIVARVAEPGEPALRRTVWLLNATFGRLTRRDWRGADKMPPTGGLVIVANHISNVDPLALGQFVAYAGRWPRFLAKESLFRVPVFGALITRCGQIPVQRGTQQAGHALDRAIDAVRSGRSVIIYPEGTITVDPDLWPMAGKTGAARVALATGCPVIPIGQWGAQEIMYGKRIHLPRLLPRKTLRLITGDPVPLDDLRDRPLTADLLRQATDRMMESITALVSTLRNEDR